MLLSKQIVLQNVLKEVDCIPVRQHPNSTSLPGVWVGQSKRFKMVGKHSLVELGSLRRGNRRTLATDSDIGRKHPWSEAKTRRDTRRVIDCTLSGSLFQGHILSFRKLP